MSQAQIPNLLKRLKVRNHPLTDRSVVFYDGGDLDGFFSAWSVFRLYTDENRPTFIPYAHSKTDLTQAIYYGTLRHSITVESGADDPDHIVFLDCAPSASDLLHLHLYYHRSHITICDHHASSRKELIEAFAMTHECTETLAGLHDVPLDQQMPHCVDLWQGLSGQLELVYSATLSGVQLSFFSFVNFASHLQGLEVGMMQPWWATYIADRDLWKHQLLYTKEINAGLLRLVQINEWNLHQLSQYWDHMDDALHMPYGSNLIIEHALPNCSPFRNTFITEIKAQGARFIDGLSSVYSSFAAAAMPTMIDGYTALAVSAPRFLRSDLGAHLNLRAKVGIVWSVDRRGAVNVSLRSRDIMGPDVAAIAKRFGGGGHKHAAGFVCDLDTLMRDVLKIKPASPS
jgi:hypothetical protein